MQLEVAPKEHSDLLLGCVMQAWTTYGQSVDMDVCDGKEILW